MCFNRQSALMDNGVTGLPYLPKGNSPNVVVLGPIGGGVSSVVNLIAGKDVAQVSNDAPRCTKKMALYHIELRDEGKMVPIILYDIPGFNYNTKSPLEIPRVPISLAIICMEDVPAQVRAAAEYLQNKWKKHGDGNIPVLVVVNHIAPQPDSNWWEENKKHLPSLGVVTDHVCLIRQKKEESTRQLQSTIIQQLTTYKVNPKTKTFG